MSILRHLRTINGIVVACKTVVVSSPQWGETVSPALRTTTCTLSNLFELDVAAHMHMCAWTSDLQQGLPSGRSVETRVATSECSDGAPMEGAVLHLPASDGCIVGGSASTGKEEGCVLKGQVRQDLQHSTRIHAGLMHGQCWHEWLLGGIGAALRPMWLL